MVNLSAPIVITFVLYVAAMVGTGLWALPRTRTFSDFALGGRRLRPSVAALSAGASDMSGWLFLALPGAVYAAGIGSAWIALGLAAGTYLNWLFVAPRLRTHTERAGNAVSLSAYLEERFEDRTRMLRLVSAAVTLVFFTLYVSSGLVAGGLLFETVFDVRFGLGASLTALVIVIGALLRGYPRLQPGVGVPPACGGGNEAPAEQGRESRFAARADRRPPPTSPARSQADAVTCEQ